MREIAAQLYGTRGRPLNYLEQTRESDNAHLARVADEARPGMGLVDAKPVKFVAPAGPPRLPESPRTSSKWAAARARVNPKWLLDILG